MDHTTAYVMLVVLLASLIRSTFGFGEALVAVPLLALALPIDLAAPLAVLLSIVIAAVVVVQDWKSVHIASATWLLVPTLIGIPLGIVLLTSAHQFFVKAVLGIVIASFSIFVLMKQPPELHSESRPWLLGCGFLAGVLGGAYGMNGPPLVIYGAMRRWSPQHMRATLQGYFLPASIVAMFGYWRVGLWTHAVTHYFLVSLLTAVPAIFVGREMNRRLRGDTYVKYVFVGLVCVGIVLVVQALRRT
jgi:uncharacterized membrane protein YfcA